MPGDVLDHLLKIEAEAADLVTNAQNEADRRTRENEEKNRAAYEEHFKAEIQKRELALKKEKEKINDQYHEALNKYHEEVLRVNTDERRFSALLNEYITRSTTPSSHNNEEGQ